jgi:ankyrin repeat protein
MLHNRTHGVYVSCRIADLESMLLAYHRETELASQLGWFHEIIQGTFHSAACLGDSQLLRRHLRTLTLRAHSSGGAGIDAVDESGMTALHWAVLRDHEVCVRILLDRGADVDALQKGLNTPLLLAAVSSTNSETLCRLLIERGADLTARNLKDHDVVFMAVLYGHASKGLPWLLQLLNAKGLDLNAPDGAGATPLHLCAKKNLARPIRMLVDSGADVNSKHGTTQLTPLQMACGHSEPDVETIRSFLDKGAYPNWRDLQGRTAFDVVLHSQQQKQQQQQQAAQGGMPSLSQTMMLLDAKASTYAAGGNHLDESTEDATDGDCFEDVSSDGGSNDGDEAVSGKGRGGGKKAVSSAPAFKGFGSKNRSNSAKLGAGSSGGASAPAAGNSPMSGQKWRAMESTIQQVGDWAVKALPALLEISKRGGKCRPQQESILQSLRPSFRDAVEEAQAVWRKTRMPGNFLEFVLVREHSGEDLRLHKTNWTKDKGSTICELCSETFSIRVRRHHCRSCGVLCCDDCSSKRLVLSAVNLSESDIAAISAGTVPAAGSTKDKDSEGVNGLERVCDGCFNRLLHEAAQPSPDHFRVKQLKRCALDVIQALEELVDSLDDPEGVSSAAFQSSLSRTLDAVALTPGGGGGSGSGGAHVDRDSAANTGPQSAASTPGGLTRSAFSFKFGGSSSSKKNAAPAPSAAGAALSRTPTASSVGIASPARGNAVGRERRGSRGGGAAGGLSNEALISALKFREAKLHRSEDVVAKFLEVQCDKSSLIVESYA